jgi:hypothetical protein
MAANNIQRQNRPDIENESLHLDRDASGMSSACQIIHDLPSLTNARCPVPSGVTHLVIIQFIAWLTHFGSQNLRSATDIGCSCPETQYCHAKATTQNHTFVRLGKVKKRVLVLGVTTFKSLVTHALSLPGLESKPAY